MFYILFFLTIFGISFAFIESSVVVYLREIYYPKSFYFPLKEIPEKILIVEVLRELSTLVLIFSSSLLIGKNRITRVGTFFYLFGVWDIFYYFFLYLFLKWPLSLSEWDLLFLIPVPWVSPVYAPTLCSITFIFLGVLTFYFWKEGFPVPIYFKDWLIFIFSSLLILFSFFYETPVVISGGIPKNFPHTIFFIGYFILNLFIFYKFFKIYKKAS